MIVAGVHGNPVNPGGEWRPWPEPADRQVGFQKDLLGQILHVLFPPDKAPDDGKDPPVMQPHEDFERLLIPSLRLLDVMGFVVGPLAFLPGRPLDTSPFDKLRGLRDRLRTILSPIVTHAGAVRLQPCFR